MSQAEVVGAMADADVFVLPSFAEGVPVVLMEAMAAGRPVITTQIAGIPELVEDRGSGRLVPAGDSSALASAIAETLQNTDLRREMGAAGRAKVSADFNVTQEAAWLARIIATYADTHTGPGKRP